MLICKKKRQSNRFWNQHNFRNWSELIYTLELQKKGPDLLNNNFLSSFIDIKTNPQERISQTNLKMTENTKYIYLLNIHGILQNVNSRDRVHVVLTF